MPEVEQLLEEPADLAHAVDEVDLEDPVAAPARPVRTPHRGVVAGGDVGLEVGAVDLLVRELADEVPGNGAAEGEARSLRLLDHEGEQLVAGALGMLVEVPTAEV